MVTLQGFGDVEENDLNPNFHLVPESKSQTRGCAALMLRSACAQRAERVQIEKTHFILSSRHSAPVYVIIW